MSFWGSEEIEQWKRGEERKKKVSRDRRGKQGDRRRKRKTKEETERLNNEQAKEKEMVQIN